MILFQEIIINAVKYASYVDRTERMVEIKLSVQDSNLVFTVSNSFSPDVQAKDTGVGNLIISNYVKILNSESVISKTDSRFTVTIEFNNYWRNHG
jgi:two-component sensor histidine kinase